MLQNGYYRGTRFWFCGVSPGQEEKWRINYAFYKLASRR